MGFGSGCRRAHFDSVANSLKTMIIASDGRAGRPYLVRQRFRYGVEFVGWLPFCSVKKLD